jgi:acetyl esterase
VVEPNRHAPAPTDEPNSETRNLLDLFESWGARSYEQVGVLRARRIVENSTGLQGEKVEVGSVADELATGEKGLIPVRIYRPAGPERRRPLIVYLHGGGWVTGSVDVADRPCRMLCAGTDSVVASVEYRRSPETPYPGPLEDCYAAVQWLAARAERFGADPSRVVIAGDSAGGNLAAATAILTRDRGGAPLAHQILLYPSLAPIRLGRCPSYTDNGTGYSLTTAALHWFWDHYVQDPVQRGASTVSLLDASDLTGLPSATVVTAQFDPLRDEAQLFVSRLRESGSTADLLRYDGTIHGFFWMAGHLGQARELVDDLDAALKSRFSQ